MRNKISSLILVLVAAFLVACPQYAVRLHNLFGGPSLTLIKERQHLEMRKELLRALQAGDTVLVPQADSLAVDKGWASLYFNRQFVGRVWEQGHPCKVQKGSVLVMVDSATQFGGVVFFRYTPARKPGPGECGSEDRLVMRVGSPPVWFKGRGNHANK